MNRNPLTERYLEQVGRGRLDPGELLETARSRMDLAATSYGGRCLSRPAFLTGPERAMLERDLSQLYAALVAVPDRLFDGDLGAFARAAQLTSRQVDAVAREQGRPPTRLARSDMYHDGTGFRLMELNIASAIGSLDNAMLNEAFLAHPGVAEFVEANQLTYVDTNAEVVETLRTECQVAEGQRPFIAAADWPARFPGLAAQLRTSAAVLARYGLDIVPCHLGQLEATGGRLWLDRRPVDVIYRLFHLDDLLEPEAPPLIDPVLQAVERGAVAMFSSLHSELYGSKAALAMLSDESSRHRYPPGELAALDRLLPWTRMVRDGPVTVAGERVDLPEYALHNREELVLKPVSRHGGIGVTLGWRVDQDEWTRRLREAMAGSYVLQRRVRAVPELFPRAGGGMEPVLLSWGVFLVSRGYGGAVVRGSTDLAGEVVTISAGATAGCCFHQEPAGPR